MGGSKGYLAREWGLSNPMTIVNLHVSILDDDMTIKLVTKDGKLFAKSSKIDGRKIATGERMLEHFMDKVSDSSRYFVLKIENPKTKKVLPIGFGFDDREKATTLNATIDDHMKQVGREIEFELEKAKQKENPSNDDDDLFADFGNLKVKDTSGAVANLAPPPLAPTSAEPLSDSKSKKKKKKKKKKKNQTNGDFGDDFDADFADFGNFESGNTGNDTKGEDWGDFGSGNGSQAFTANAGGYSAQNSSPAAQLPNSRQQTNTTTTTDILGLFS